MPYDITLYQVGAPLIALFFVVYAWNHVLRGTKTFWEAILWTIFWGGIATIVLFPWWMGVIAGWMGIKEEVNAVFAIAIGITLFIVFRILMQLERVNQRITELARAQALREAGIGEESSISVKSREKS
jgi:hypothetical protein